MYTFLWGGKGILIFRTDNNELAKQVIARDGLKSVSEEDLAALA